MSCAGVTSIGSGPAPTTMRLPFGPRRQCLDRRHHVLLISAVVADASNLHVLAITKIAAPAFGTGVVVSAVPADSNALTLLPFGNARTHFIDGAHDFVSRHAGILNSGQ